jgi:hypothetical protein
MRRTSVGLLKKPIKTLNAKQGKIVNIAFADEAEEAFAIAA